MFAKLWRNRLPLTVCSRKLMCKLAPLLVTFLVLTACSSTSHFRTHVTEIPCEKDFSGSCANANLLTSKEHDYTLGFVEIDDQGQLYDQRQVDTLMQLLQTETRPLYVTLFVHGWHHNASANDFNVRRFEETLKDLQQRNPAYKMVGIYVGWQGETLSVPWLRNLTFWDRKQVTEEVGRNALLEFLLQLESTVKNEQHPKNRLLTVGLSLGASVVFNALHPILLQRLVQPDNHQLLSGYGDLVVLVNPAFEAIRYAAIREAAQRYAQKYGFSEQQNPLLIIATSEADGITKNSFALSRKLSTVFEQHRMYNSMPASEDEDPQALSEWELDTTAVGHFRPYITHRLQTLPPATQANMCAANPGWLTSAVQQQKQTQLNTGLAATGAGWDAVLNAALHMELRHLQHSSANNPYWVLQTDPGVLPSHGFINQQHLWCFIDQALLGTQNTELRAKQ